MSFVDWDFLTPSGSTNFSTSAQINAGLSSPLLVGGTYARAVSLFGNFGSVGFYVQGTAAIKAAYQSGAFFNIPSTRAVRVQACLRLTNTVGSFSEFGLIAAGTKILNDGSSAAGSILTGYSIGVLKQGAATTLRLFTNCASTLGNLSTQSVNLGAAALATWYSLRMDVFPLGATADRIICSQETTPGSGSWTELLDTTLYQGVSSGYVSWGGNRRTGFGMASNSDGGGGSPGGATGVIDLATFSVGNAPTPIP